MIYPHYPQCLNKGEFAVVRFSLELLSDGELSLEHLLSMRRLLRRAAEEVLEASALTMFEPALSCDPVALRRFQKPAPGFVLRPEADGVGAMMEGDRITFEVLFLGDAIRLINDLLSVLQQVGKNGLNNGDLCFDLADVHTLEPGGTWLQSRCGYLGNNEFAPGLIRLDQWLEQAWPEQLPIALEFVTPVRLVAGGRILRRPRFDQLFPFMLRRVTSMLHAHCALEPVEEPSLLLRTACEVEAVWGNTCWVDWREVGDKECLGGLTGTLRVAGRELDEVLWVVLLATLFGVGKGATYGAGRCRLREVAALSVLDII